MVKKFLTALAVILAVCIPICIYAGEYPVYGDVNGDGAVNSKDLTRLMKYVAGENVEIYGGDINGDGTVNAKDLTRLMKYISGDITKPDLPELDADTVNEILGSYKQTYKFIAFREGSLYGLSDMTAFGGRVAPERKDGNLYVDSSALAQALGLDHSFSAETGSLKLSYNGTDFVFNISDDTVTADGRTYAVPHMYISSGRAMLSLDSTANLFGYTFSEDSSNNTSYIAISKNHINSATKKTADERFELYDNTVCDISDVQAFGNYSGVGKYEKTPSEERLVGIAYTTWHNKSQNWGSGTWGTPLYGTYSSDDREMIYRHGKMFAEAGIDFIFVDWSNNTTYHAEDSYDSGMSMIEDATDLLFEVWSEIPGAPKICIFVGPGHSGYSSVLDGNHQRKVEQVYDRYVNNPEYADMYFYYEGKPLLMCYGSTPVNKAYLSSDRYSASWDDSRFTTRWLSGYVNQQNVLLESSSDKLSKFYWSWEERGEQSFSVKNGRVEAITVSAATRPGGNVPAYERNNGETLKKQFQRANDLGAGIVLLTTWNEWIYGEQPSAEGSRDLEPSRQHGTFYYDLMCQQIYKFKGLK